MIDRNEISKDGVSMSFFKKIIGADQRPLSDSIAILLELLTTHRALFMNRILAKIEKNYGISLPEDKRREVWPSINACLAPLHMLYVIDAILSKKYVPDNNDKDIIMASIAKQYSSFNDKEIFEKFTYYYKNADIIYGKAWNKISGKIYSDIFRKLFAGTPHIKNESLIKSEPDCDFPRLTPSFELEFEMENRGFIVWTETIVEVSFSRKLTSLGVQDVVNLMTDNLQKEYRRPL